MSYRLKFTLPGLPKMTNVRGSSHWRHKHNEAKRWKQDVWVVVTHYGKPDKPLERAKLTLTRHSTTAPDPDGLVSGFKHVIDGLVEAGVLVDDKYKNIGMPDYRWEKAKRGQGFITVEVCSDM